jgi:hypothetical protein
MAHDGLQEEPFGTGGTTLHFETARPGSRRVPKYAYALLFAAVRSQSSWNRNDIKLNTYGS